jgi:TonB-dependent SusC/RagA subfamily outer membrane receptor
MHIKKNQFLVIVFSAICLAVAFSSCRASKGLEASKINATETAIHTEKTEKDKLNFHSKWEGTSSANGGRSSLNIGQALQNRIAGVTVLPTGGGVPGQNLIIRIRGTNSINSGNDPLYVLDGIMGIANPLSTLNPNDIKSIEVLKDASSLAFYGARGANGVVLITTKRGGAGF